MTARATRLYWKLPYAAKKAATYVGSWRMERERYGRDFHDIIDEISAHDRWSRDELQEYQLRKLRGMIIHAACHVPYYRNLFRAHGIDPASIRMPDDLSKLPLLEKATARTQERNLVDERMAGSGLVVLHTSGTTGTPLRLYRDVRTNSLANAFMEARCHGVAGMRRRINRSVSIGGILVAAPGRRKPPFWIHNARWNQLYLSSYHLSPDNLPHYVDTIRAFGADYIEGYPSSVYTIAKHIIDNRLDPVAFKACFTTAEALFDYHREAIRGAFGCKTYNQYGCGEIAIFAAECEHGSMHLSPEISLIEVLDEHDRPVRPGEAGTLVCTGIANGVQPFIRYRLGDFGSLKEGSCACGRSLPLLGHIEGRLDQMLVMRDGRRIGRLDPVFKDCSGIAEAQIVQDDYDRFRIRLVPGADYTDRMGAMAAANLADRVGPGCDIGVELVERIERTAAGKFKAIVCNVRERPIAGRA